MEKNKRSYALRNWGSRCVLNQSRKGNNRTWSAIIHPAMDDCQGKQSSGLPKDTLTLETIHMDFRQMFPKINYLRFGSYPDNKGIL